jgi:hypothetical protein
MTSQWCQLGSASDTKAGILESIEIDRNIMDTELCFGILSKTKIIVRRKKRLLYNINLDLHVTDCG